MLLNVFVYDLFITAFNKTLRCLKHSFILISNAVCLKGLETPRAITFPCNEVRGKLSATLQRMLEEI